MKIEEFFNRKVGGDCLGIELKVSFLRKGRCSAKWGAAFLKSGKRLPKSE